MVVRRVDTIDMTSSSPPQVISRSTPTARSTESTEPGSPVLEDSYSTDKPVTDFGGGQGPGRKVDLKRLGVLASPARLERRPVEWDDAGGSHRGRTTGIGDGAVLYADARGGKGMGGNGNATKNVTAKTPPPPAPPPPSPPPDMGALGTFRDRVEHAHLDPNIVSDNRRKEICASLGRAKDASARGDYKAAVAEYKKLGFPIPAGGQASSAADDTMFALGITTVKYKGDQWQVSGWHMGKGGNQDLNDLQGLSQNAVMMDSMLQAKIGPVDNPPTRDQARAYMKYVASKTNDPKQILEASRTLIDGSVMHYSSAGPNVKDPEYGKDGKRFFVQDPRTKTWSRFDSQADAEAAAKKLHVHRITTFESNVPDTWPDAFSMPTRAGRHIGDCENKLYLQHQLLDAAGFTAIGSAYVSAPHGDGHALGFFRSQDGRVFVSSNEGSYEVDGRGKDGAVTRADVERTAQKAITDLYHAKSARGFSFAYANEPAGSQIEPGVESQRRAQEYQALRTSERLKL